MSDEMIVDDGGGRQRSVRVNYPANSKRVKENGGPQKPILERPKEQKVVTGNVVKRKKPLLSRFGNSMVAENSESVGQYIIMEVLLPAAKNMISDAISQGIDRLLFGDGARRRSSEVRSAYTSYNRIKPPTTSYDTRRNVSRRTRADDDFSDFVMETRSEAQAVIDRLRGIIEEYEAARVSDLYDLVGLTGSFVDDRWGWTDLTRARVTLARGGGYLLDLPRQEPLD